MNTIKKTLTGLAMAFAISGATSAQAATLTNWFLDTDGAGGNAAVLVQDFVDLTGTAYVHNTFSNATDFTFQEGGRFLELTADGATLLNPSLSSTFFGTGTGQTGAGGTLLFSTGTLEIFSGLNSIATFDLQSGSANLIANSTLPNGTVSLIFQATSLDAGYFFDSALTDLSTLVSTPGGLVFGFSTTNAISLANGTATVGAALANVYNNAFNPDIAPTLVANNTTDLLISNNGQFRLSTVPEPATLALLGLGMIGLAGMKRSRA